MFLSENSRPAWVLTPLNAEGDEIVWLPTAERMLEDAIVQIAACVLKAPGVSALVDSPESRHELRDIPNGKREELYALCKGLEHSYKLIVTVLRGSSLAAQSAHPGGISNGAGDLYSEILETVLAVDRQIPGSAGLGSRLNSDFWLPILNYSMH